MRVRNESWIIKYALHCLSDYVDSIVIIDDASSDDTPLICGEFPKVKALVQKNRTRLTDIDEVSDWNKLTRLALKQQPDWILYTDADEMLQPSIKDFVRDDLPGLDRYDMIRFRKITPWRSLDFYRIDQPRFDHPANVTLNPVFVRSDVPIRWHDGKGGFWKKCLKRVIRGERSSPCLGRGFPHGVKNVLDCDNLCSLHLNSLSDDSHIRKLIFYGLIESYCKPFKSPLSIMEWIIGAYSNNNIALREVPPNLLWDVYSHLIDIEL